MANVLINDAVQQNIYMIDLAIYHQLHDLIYGTAQTSQPSCCQIFKSVSLNQPRAPLLGQLQNQSKPSDTTPKSVQAAKLPADMEKETCKNYEIGWIQNISVS